MELLKKLLFTILLILTLSFGLAYYGYDYSEELSSNDLKFVNAFNSFVQKNIKNKKYNNQIKYIEKIEKRANNIINKLYDQEYNDSINRLTMILYSIQNNLYLIKSELRINYTKNIIEKNPLNNEENEKFNDAMILFQKNLANSIENKLLKKYYNLLDNISVSQKGSGLIDFIYENNNKYNSGSIDMIINFDNMVANTDGINADFKSDINAYIKGNHNNKENNINIGMIFSLIQKNYQQFFKIENFEAGGTLSDEQALEFLKLLKYIETYDNYIKISNGMNEEQLNFIYSILGLFNKGGLNNFAGKKHFIPIKKSGNKIYFIISLDGFKYLNSIFSSYSYDIENDYYLMVGEMNDNNSFPYIIIDNDNYTIGLEVNDSVKLNSQIKYNKDIINSFVLNIIPNQEEYEGQGIKIDYEYNNKLNFSFIFEEVYEKININFNGNLSGTNFTNIDSNYYVGEKNYEDENFSQLLSGKLLLLDNKLEGIFDINKENYTNIKIDGITNINNEIEKINLEVNTIDSENNKILSLLINYIKSNSIGAKFDYESVGINSKGNFDLLMSGNQINYWNFDFNIGSILGNLTINNKLEDGDINGKIIINNGINDLLTIVSNGKFINKYFELKNKIEFDINSFNPFAGKTNIIKAYFDILSDLRNDNKESKVSIGFEDETKENIMKLIIESFYTESKLNEEILAPNKYEEINLLDIYNLDNIELNNIKINK